MYALIGDGRVARHFAHYFDSLGIEYRIWARRQDPDTVRLGEVLADASHVLVLIKDSAIAPFIESRPDLDGKVVVHFSGSLVTPLAVGAHPLMTFGPELYSLSRYREIPFVVERGRGSLQELLPGLENPCWHIDPGEKPYYHALCVLGGNFTCLLWEKVFSEFQSRFELPAEAAYPYLRQIAENLENRRIDALTGPLARRDRETIEKNLEALAEDPFRVVYEGFLRAYEESNPL